MSEETQGAVATESPGGTMQAGPMDRSTISFPYDDLAAAVGVAKALLETYGGNCQMDQLAGHYQAKTTSGSFRNKITAARIFGLIEVGRKGIRLTDLGGKILDERTSDEAKVAAFLHVPLYAAIYDRFQHKTLPGTTTGLEAAILSLGVAPKQVTIARRRFQKSAEIAGFFDHGTDRLVTPVLTNKPQGEDDPDRGTGTNGGKGGASGGRTAVETHPLMVGMLQSLPAPGADFSYKDRERWLRTVKANFDYIYGPVEEKEGRGQDAATESTSSSVRDIF